MRYLFVMFLVLSGLGDARAEWYFEKDVGGLTGRVIGNLVYDDFDNALALRCGDTPSVMTVSYVFVDVSITAESQRKLNREGVFFKWRVDKHATDGRKAKLLKNGEFSVLSANLDAEAAKEFLKVKDRISVGLQRVDAEIFHERTYPVLDDGLFREMISICMSD